VRTAALTLEAYLRAKGANFGSRAKPSEAVRTFQTVANVNPDGIMGPITRAAGEAVGVRFPFPGDATSGAVVIPAPVVDPAVLNSATAIGASTPQAAAAKMQSVAAVQTALGVTPTGQIDSATKQQAAALGVALPPTGTTTAHNPFGAHSCAADLPPKYGPVRDALVSFASARPEYLFSKHQSQCLAGLLSVLTSSARGGWSTAKPDAQGTGWLALGPLNLTTPTAEWLLQSKGVLKPFDTKLKVSGATGTRDRAASLRTSATTPASGAWWYILTLAKLEDMLRPALDLPSFAASGLLTPNPSAPPSAAPLAQQLSTAVNALVKANPTEDPISILMRLFLKASSLKGMVTAAQKADGKIP
jgi:hypothetical protein